MENPEFLKQKYGLHNTPEVESAAQRTEAQSGEKVPQKPENRIQNYLDRFTEILDREDPEKRERGVEALKQVLHEKFVIKPEEIPESYFETQKRIARERGQGEIEVTDEIRRQHAEVIIADQEGTLDNWIDYLASLDATYPDWLKYYAVRSVLGLGGYDKEKKQFAKRDKGTVKPFPDLNREALAYVLDVMEKKYRGEKPNLAAMEAEDKIKFEQLLAGENFGKLYAWAIEKVTPDSVKLMSITEGRWVKYEKGSDHMSLVQSLQSHGTGWCTAGESTAEAQLKKGDFYVYYSLDQKGEAKIPRVAIRMDGGAIAEVRGVAPQQNLDPYIATVAQEKLKEFPDGEKYEKKVRDMKMLTEIDNRVKRGGALTRDDLIFLYEIESPIEGFGYQHDMRNTEIIGRRNNIEGDARILFLRTTAIENKIISGEPLNKEDLEYLYEINGPIENFHERIGWSPLKDKRAEKFRAQRNLEQDMLVIFECTREEIARVPSQINENTKVYVGTLEPGIFQKFPENLEHIYTSFPDKKIRRENVEIGGKSAEQLISEIGSAGINLGFVISMLQNREFVPGKNPEEATLIRLTVADLGFKDQATTDEIYERAQILGLELCPADTGPNYRLKYQDQPLNEWIYIGMKQIAAPGGGPSIFRLGHDEAGLWLSDDWASERKWHPHYKFVFRLPDRKTKIG